MKAHELEVHSFRDSEFITSESRTSECQHGDSLTLEILGLLLIFKAKNSDCKLTRIFLRKYASTEVVIYIVFIRLHKSSPPLVIGYITFFRCKIRSFGKCIKMNLLRTKAARDYKIEAQQRYTTTALSLIQDLRKHQISKVLVIGVNYDEMLSSFKKMLLLLE